MSIIGVLFADGLEVGRFDTIWNNVRNMHILGSWRSLLISVETEPSSEDEIIVIEVPSSCAAWRSFHNCLIQD